MRLMIRLAVYFYIFVILWAVILVGVFVSQIIPFRNVIVPLHRAYYEPHMRIGFGVAALVLLLLNHAFLRVISGDHRRGKTITFDNPSGRVHVSLAALEDLVRRVVSKVPEVKEGRSYINQSARKKKLRVSLRLILNADVHIPEMTYHLQELVKSKIQDIIGIEETVEVRVDIIKIIPVSGREKYKENKPEEEIPTFPFQGYRA